MPASYQVFDTSPAATMEDIDRLFRRLIRACHPDNNIGDQEAAAAARLAQIKKAYNILTNLHHEEQAAEPKKNDKDVVPKKNQRCARVSVRFTSPEPRKTPLKGQKRNPNPYNAFEVAEQLRIIADYVDEKQMQTENMTRHKVEKLLSNLLLKHSVQDQLISSAKFVHSILNNLDTILNFLKDTRDLITTTTKHHWDGVVSTRAKVQDVSGALQLTHERLLDYRDEDGDCEIWPPSLGAPVPDPKTRLELEQINGLLASHCGKLASVVRGIVEPCMKEVGITVPMTAAATPTTATMTTNGPGSGFDFNTYWGPDQRRAVWLAVGGLSFDLDRFRRECAERSSQS